MDCWINGAEERRSGGVMESWSDGPEGGWGGADCWIGGLMD